MARATNKHAPTPIEKIAPTPSTTTNPPITSAGENEINSQVMTPEPKPPARKRLISHRIKRREMRRGPVQDPGTAHQQDNGKRHRPRLNSLPLYE